MTKSAQWCPLIVHAIDQGGFPMDNRALVNGYAVTASLLLLTLAPRTCLAQMPSEPGYLETTWIKIRQDKVAEFSQMAMRIADANRRSKGENWTASVDMYGKDNYVWMTSIRSSLSEIEPGMNKFGSALKEFMGYSMDRFMAESSKVADSSGTELRVRRLDLSWNIKDMPSWLTQVGKAKYLATIRIRVKPGRLGDAEKQLMMIRDASNGKAEALPGAVSQVRFGGDPGTFWITIPLSEITDVSKMLSPRSLLGEEAYRQYSEMAAQNYANLEYSLKRFVPEWSNPPAAFVEANSKFWTVKAPVAPRSKATPATAKPAGTTAQ
jgi:hypothetical protein